MNITRKLTTEKLIGEIHAIAQKATKSDPKQTNASVGAYRAVFQMVNLELKMKKQVRETKRKTRKVK